MDGLLQATFTPHSNLTMYLKYRYKQKERDLTGSKRKPNASYFSSPTSISFELFFMEMCLAVVQL